MEEKKILIIGGGFAGIRVALDLAEKKMPNMQIKLVSDKHHFEYYPALYKAVTGHSPLEICVPLSEIFLNKKVEIENDKIIELKPDEKKAIGASGSHYSYDFLILALGSETAYFNIPNLEKLAFSLKSINEALKLQNHIHEMFDQSHNKDIPKEEIVANLHFLIVGGGASGVELAGELAVYLKKLSKKHDIDNTLPTIDLIEAAPRILSLLPPAVSEKVTARLRKLGVNIFTNRALVSEDLEQVYMKDMTLKTKTVIWTAGIRTNNFYAKIPGITILKNSRVEVDEFLEAKGLQDVFIIGDAADTTYAGFAQTALSEGEYVATTIRQKLKGQKTKPYKNKKVSYLVPTGPNWAAAVIGPVHFYGRLAWYLRNLIDLHFFTTILPLRKAIIAFQSGKKICQSCPTCEAVTS